MVVSQAVPGGSNNPGWQHREENGTVRKSGLSCAECRRSKLKCDRVFPCQSCIRRGCAAICPDGALSATKGNKVLVARVERLQGQVKNMSSRIKELEAALADSQAHAGKQQHPLLAGGVKWEEADDAGLPPESDTDSVVGAPYDDNDEEYSQQIQGEQEMASLDMHHLGLPSEICNLATAFPLGVSDRPNLHLYFLQFIPRRERAIELSKLYYQFSSWMYKPVSPVDFDDLLQTLYATSSTPDAPKAHAHSLAVFFMIMCIGSLFDAVHPDHELHTERYHALARAALSSHSIVHQRTCTTVQALFLLNLYKYIIPRPSPEYRWLMSGICARLAQAMGLQRDCSGWGFNPEEVQRRRTVFWELFVFETWTSLLSGRPSLLNLRQINCRFPEDREPVTYNGEVEIGFHSWLFRFAAGCMSLAVQHVFSSRKPTYAMLTELDTKIRRFPVPRYLRCPIETISTPWSEDPAIAMQQFCAYGHVEHTILYLHRSHFAQVRGEPMQETVGRSVWSIYRSSARLIRALTSLYHRHPDMTSKMWYFWSAYYSASIAIGALVLDRPWCQLAPHALAVVTTALEVYERGSKTCSIPSTLRILQNLVERSTTAYHEHRHSGSTKKCNADCCPNISPDDARRFAEGDDELIPGQALEKSPDTRYASASPPSTGNGEPFVDSSSKSPASNSAPVSMHSQVASTMPSPPIHTPPAPPSSAVPDPAQTAYPNYMQFMPSSIGVGQPASGPFTYTPQVEEPWFYTPASAHAAFAMDYSPSSAEAFDGLNPWNARKADGSQNHGPPHQHMAPQPYRVPSMHGPPHPQGSHPLSNMTPYHPASSSQTSLHAAHLPGDGQQSMWHNYVPQQHHHQSRAPSQWG